MTLSESIAKRLLDLCNQRSISLNKLASISGVTQSTLQSIIQGYSKNPKISTIKSVCEGLQITLSEFFDDPDINESE